MVECRQLKKKEKLFNGNAHCTTRSLDICDIWSAGSSMYGHAG